MLKHGAEANAKGDENGMTPLHFAVLGGYADIAELLLNYGADVKPDDQDKLLRLQD